MRLFTLAHKFVYIYSHFNMKPVIINYPTF